MQTIIETREFMTVADKLFTVEELEALKLHLLHTPEAGVIIRGTGGLRKLRWGVDGRGKRGGVRVIYFVFNRNAPLYLLTVYAKNQHDDMSAEHKSKYRAFTEILKKEYRHAE